MLNCGLGILIMPFAAAVLLWKADTVRGFLEMVPQGDVLLLAAGTVCLFCSMNDMSAPSVSLEGKNLWLLQSFPVSDRQTLTAKLKLHLLLTLIPAAVLLGAVEWVLRPEPVFALLILAVAVLFVLLLGTLGFVLNLKMPNLDWTSEVVPIKQSLGVMITLFGGWAIVVGLAGLYLPLRGVLGPAAYLFLVSVVLLLAGAVLFRWLMTEGARRFETL